jgi:hemoglobin-like flavoprotein
MTEYSKDLKKNQTKFYQNWLSENPQYHKLFPCRHVPVTDFPNTPYMRDTQGVRFGASIIDLVSKMEDMPALKKAVHDLVYAPGHIDNMLKREDYVSACKTFVKTMREVLCEKMTPTDVEAWERFFTKVLDMIDEELKMCLTETDKVCLRTTLNEYVKDLKMNQTKLYQNLLGDYPQYYSLFPGGKVSDIVPTCPVGDLLEKMQDPRGLMNTVREVVFTPGHSQWNLNKEDYANAFKSMLKTFQQVMGDKLKTQDLEAWKKFDALALQTIEGELEK